MTNAQADVATSAEVALMSENEELATQLAKSFEELSFLRRLASTLVIDRVAVENEPFAELLNELCEVVCASSLYLFHGAIDDDRCGFVSAGDHSMPFALARALVLAYRSDAAQRPFVLNKPVEGFPVESLILIKINSGRDHGWLLACNHADQHAAAELGFSSVEANLLLSAASMMASHYRNLELLRQKEHLFTDMVRALVNAVDARDPYTCGHSERVAMYARRLAEHIGLSQADCERLYLTGLLHDVGKIAVPDAVLRKCGKLSEVEFNAIAQHPRIGYRMLLPVNALRPVLPGVLHHHESVDGTGYPDCLAGEEIPFDARILAICDAYDAMTSDRPYRQGMPHDRAIQILANGAGTQWDRELTERFLECADHIRRIGEQYVDQLALSREIVVEQPCDDYAPMRQFS
ncbi:MAG: HD-GYP domain-containing protein [Planctomycetales bacterium]|nr:HD-GYP domain-containing protein [Planctomycetales bacterium]